MKIKEVKIEDFKHYVDDSINGKKIKINRNVYHVFITQKENNTTNILIIALVKEIGTKKGRININIERRCIKLDLCEEFVSDNSELTQSDIDQINIRIRKINELL